MPQSQSLPPLLPRPQRVRRRTGTFRLSPEIPIVLPQAADPRIFRAAQVLGDEVMKRCGFRLPVEHHERREGLGPHIFLKAVGSGAEAYRLRVTSGGIDAIGRSEAAVRHAVETLRQMIPASGRVPACEIDDKPELAIRGLMLDVSRGKVPTFESLCEIVDRCAAWKFNTLMLYTEHTFRFRRHPAIGRDDSPMDAETLARLDAYAAINGVELIPSLQSLGHMHHILKLKPYRSLAETGRRFTISPTKRATVSLLRDLYDEYLPNFRSPWFNANCDEPYDLEQGPSKKRADKLGPGAVYLEHVRRVRDLAREHGKRTMIWADVVHAHPERIPEIDTDLVLLDWWYEADFDFDRVKVFAENGLAFVVCPGTSSWNCLFPRVENSQLNIARYAAAGKRHGASGLLVTDWGDHGHYNLQGNSWYAFGWAAQHAWSGPMANREYDRAFSQHGFRDTSGRVGRLYRELGAIHDAGFNIFNGSALQYLFFDDLTRAPFSVAAKPAPLARSQRRLERLTKAFDAADSALARDPQTQAELRYAFDASRFAVRKASKAVEFLDWRRGASQPTAAERRRLANAFEDLATSQVALSRRLKQLWLARAHPSNFEFTQKRIHASVRSMRSAARSLRANRIPRTHPVDRFDARQALADSGLLIP